LQTIALTFTHFNQKPRAPMNYKANLKNIEPVGLALRKKLFFLLQGSWNIIFLKGIRSEQVLL